MGLSGHGIPSGIAVTFRMIPPGNKRTWDRTDMGSLLGSYLPYPLISEAWLSGLALSHVLHLTLVGRAKKYHRTVQKYVCTVQYLDGLRHTDTSSNELGIVTTQGYCRLRLLRPSSLDKYRPIAVSQNSLSCNTFTVSPNWTTSHSRNLRSSKGY
jgi:hypothetical protein